MFSDAPLEVKLDAKSVAMVRDVIQTVQNISPLSARAMLQQLQTQGPSSPLFSAALVFL